MSGWKLGSGGGAIVPAPLEEGDILTAGAGPAWGILAPIGPANVGVLQIVGTGSPAQWGLVDQNFMESGGSALGAMLTSGGGFATPTWGQIVKAGAFTITGNGTPGPYTITYSVAFPNTIQSVVVSHNSSGTLTTAALPIVGSVSKTGFTLSFGVTSLTSGQTYGFEFVAVGT